MGRRSLCGRHHTPATAARGTADPVLAGSAWIANSLGERCWYKRRPVRASNHPGMRHAPG